MDDLKPCPFCGGDAQYSEVDKKWLVECEVCICSTSIPTHHHKTAASYWNKRIDDNRIAELEAQIPRWVPVSERLPDQEGEFLGGFFDSHMMSWEVLYFQHGNWYLSDESLAKPMYWMPLPDPPE